MSDQGAVEHWAQVDRLLDRVLALPITDRAAFVQQQTTDDPRLRDEVMALLADLGTRGDLLDRPALGALSRGVPALGLQPGHRIGAYKVLGLLGQGGMGEVYRAERADGQFDHEVAIKVLRQDAVEHLGLFVSERRILAKLEHPGIARLYDAGIGDDSRPYMVMELVEGILITQWCRERKADLKQRLELFAQVCDAVAYAHQNLIIHRDLKPGNILVTDDGRTKLLDFGVALLSGTAEDATRNAPMTLSYAAPEQLTRAAMSTATDIYALGVLLFELLTERLPWATAQMPIATAIDNVLHETAPSPSTFAASMPAPPVPTRLLAGDLDAIVGKALRKTPADRYTTVVGMQTDVRRHAQGEPVVAREGAGFYVFGRFLRRYRWAVAGVAMLVITLSAGLAGTIWQARRAEAEARTATAVQEFLTDLFRATAHQQEASREAREATARDLLDLSASRIDTVMAGAPEAKLNVLQLLSQLYDDLALDGDAASMRGKVVSLALAIHGPNSTKTASVLVEQASAMDSSTFEERAGILAQAAAILDRKRDFTSSIRADLLAQLAVLHRNDIPKALDFARQAVRIYESSPPSSAYAEALSFLGWSEMRSGLAREASAHYKQAISVSRTADGFPNPVLPRYYATLSNSEYEMQDIASAEQSARLALRAAILNPGENHVDRLQTEMQLGEILFDTGRTHAGLKLLKAAKQRSLRIRGADDPLHTPATLLMYGSALSRFGLLEEGLTDMQRATGTRRSFRSGSLYLATMLDLTASGLAEAGHIDAATASLDEATRIRAGSGLKPGTEPYNVNTGTRIQLALAAGQSGVARELLGGFFVEPDEALEISFNAIEKELLTAEIEQAEGGNAASIALARRVRARIAKSGLDKYLTFYAMRADLIEGRATLQQRNPETALQLLQRTLRSRQALLDPSSPRIAEAQIALAQCHLALGHTAQARTLASSATDIHDLHKNLGEQYRRPLRQLQSKLAGATR